MEALLANYASDDDEDSNPPPKSSSQAFPSITNSSGTSHSFRKSALFSSLPPPKDPSGKDSSGKAMRPEGPDLMSVSDQRSTKLEDKSGSVVVSGKKSSLFSALPPPRSSKVFPDSSTQSEALPRGTKRVVEFRPSIDISVLKEEDDDDEATKARAKRWASDSEKSKGLASILPKPKYSGSSLGLGSGHSSSGRMSLEINDDDAKRKESTLPANITQPGKNDVRPNPNDGAEFPITVNLGSSTETWANRSLDYPQGLHNKDDQSQWASYSSAYPPGLQTNNEESKLVSYSSAYSQGLQTHEEQSQWVTPHTSYDGSISEPHHSGMPSHDYHTFMAHEAAQGTETTEDPLANILMKERRKGGKLALPTVIEVKQSELTVNKVREDQVRSTGIAFGPAYQPVSNKGKPSKLHRRKHQIGTLYFDMKQKEMELMERRSRGIMSKSETQAKYGW